MNQKIHVATAGLAAVLAMPLVALDPSHERDRSEKLRAEQHQERDSGLHSGQTDRAWSNPKSVADIVGMDIKSGDETIGKVDEIFINLESGKILAWVVTTDGLPAPGTQKNLISPNDVRFDSHQENLRSVLNKEQIRAAPRYRPRQGDDSPGNNLPLSGLVGMSIESRDGHSIGSIHEVYVDLESGQGVGVVSIRGFLGIGGRKSVLALNELDYNAEKKTLLTNLDRKQLREAPEYKANDGLSLFKALRGRFDNATIRPAPFKKVKNSGTGSAT